MIMKKVCLFLLSCMVVDYAYAMQVQDHKTTQEPQKNEHIFQVGKKRSTSCLRCFNDTVEGLGLYKKLEKEKKDKK